MNIKIKWAKIFLAICLFSVLSYLQIWQISSIWASFPTTLRNKSIGRSESGNKSIGTSKLVRKELSLAKSKINNGAIDEAEKIVNKLLESYPLNKKVLALNEHIKEVQHNENNKKLLVVNMVESKKNIDMLENQIIPYSGTISSPGKDKIESTRTEVIYEDTKQENKPISTRKMIRRKLSNVKSEIKNGTLDKAESIVDGLLEEFPTNVKAIAFKEHLQRLRHLENIENLHITNMNEMRENVEMLEEQIIPYTEIMRFPPKEDMERIEKRQIPDRTKIFEGMKDRTAKMRIVTDPDGKIPADIKDALDMIISFEFYQVALQDALAFLREKIDINLIPDRDLPNEPVTLKLNNVTIRTALKYILPEKVNYEVVDNLVFIRKEKMVLRVYDVRDLLINLDDRISKNDGGGGGGGGSRSGGGSGRVSDFVENNIEGERRNANDRVNELIRLISMTIEPESWKDGQGRMTTREDRPGDLLVVNTEDIHNQIEDVLTSMRASQHLQVSIEARFIKMSDKFLQDIGVELRNVSLQRDSESSSIDFDVDTSAGDAGASAISKGLNFSYSVLKDFQFEFLLNAVQESDEAEVLTTPRITLSNTQRGSIRVVNELTYVESYEIISQVPQPVIAVVEDGTTFDVRPVVSTDRKHVFLEVHPNITIVTFQDLAFPVSVPFESANGGTTFQVLNLTIEQPQVNRQELSVTVDVPDRGTLMVGGLGTTEKRIKSGGVPVLSKIPLLKRLFSRDSEVIDRSNLVIILRPTILNMEEELRAKDLSKNNKVSMIR